MIQSFSIFNSNNFPESYLSKVFTLSSHLSYVAAPGTARHCYVETVTLRLARSQQNIVTERRCARQVPAGELRGWWPGRRAWCSTSPASRPSSRGWLLVTQVLQGRECCQDAGDAGLEDKRAQMDGTRPSWWRSARGTRWRSAARRISWSAGPTGSPAPTAPSKLRLQPGTKLPRWMWIHANCSHHKYLFSSIYVAGSG